MPYPCSSAMPLLLTLVAMGLGGCAGDPQRDAAVGVDRPAGLGALAGKRLARADGSPYLGDAIAAIDAAAVGPYMNHQRQALEHALADEIGRKKVEIVVLGNSLLRIGVASDLAFDAGSAQLGAAALKTFSTIATTLQGFDQTVIHVVGHADVFAPVASAQGLSERRAASVSSYLASRGLAAQRLRDEGRGGREAQMFAADRLGEGPRRIDIVVRAVVAGDEATAWMPPDLGD